MNPLCVLKLDSNCTLQSVDDGAVLLRLSDGQIYSCNETTQCFLGLVDGERNFSEIVHAFRQEYAVDEATAIQDLSSLANQMLAEGVIVKST